MSEFVLAATKRELLKKEATKRYRKEGFIPCIIYGQGTNSNLLIKTKEFNRLHPKLTKSTVITINFEGKNFETLIKDYDKDYLKGEFKHIDFFELKKGQATLVTIPLKLVGTPIGLRTGGIMDVHLDSINIECKPADIVTFIEIDISKLDVGQNIHVKDLALNPKFKLLTSIDEVIVAVTAGKE